MDRISSFPSVFSVDVEDWFHILDVSGTPPLNEWERLPSRVEANFRRLLDIFSSKRARMSCFFLGWVAQRFPHLVTEAAARGHEIASHGYAHRLVYEMTCAEFQEDAARSRRLLEDISGCAVLGFRSPGFSVTNKTPWFFDALAEAGYCYDSSIFPTRRAHGGMPGAIRNPHAISARKGMITEFPITVSNLCGGSVCVFGGGYLRLSPYWIIRRQARQVLNEGRPVVFYVHPRELDPSQPRLPMPLKRRFKSYVNLHTTEAKVTKLLEEFPMTTFRELLAATPHAAAA